MKYLLFSFLLLAGTCPVLAQATKPAQYSILEVKNNGRLTLVTGENSATTGQTQEVAQVASIKYEVDALNYLSSQDWEIISTTTVIGATRHYLRRKF